MDEELRERLNLGPKFLFNTDLSFLCVVDNGGYRRPGISDEHRGPAALSSHSSIKEIVIYCARAI